MYEQTMIAMIVIHFQILEACWKKNKRRNEINISLFSKNNAKKNRQKRPTSVSVIKYQTEM